mmetsp:Transcript_32413/g.55386  ORF Transcript_32413/g.55386 Transcript_32413/m.55386 type:complete len:215 (-) Transcript_32413:494-1138(-)
MPPMAGLCKNCSSSPHCFIRQPKLLPRKEPRRLSLLPSKCKTSRLHASWPPTSHRVAPSCMICWRTSTRSAQSVPARCGFSTWLHPLQMVPVSKRTLSAASATSSSPPNKPSKMLARNARSSMPMSAIWRARSARNKKNSSALRSVSSPSKTSARSSWRRLRSLRKNCNGITMCTWRSTATWTISSTSWTNTDATRRSACKNKTVVCAKCVSVC